MHHVWHYVLIVADTPLSQPKANKMQTISTIYFGPTDRRGARIRARASGGYSTTLPYDHKLNELDNHMAAARHLMRTLNWRKEAIGGDTATGMMWVIDAPNAPRILPYNL